jgi:geranyl-CoA carboxylase alpha subunit
MSAGERAVAAQGFDRVLIANRGEIACRIARTARRMGMTTVAVYAATEADAPHVAACDVAIGIGGETPAESYLVADRILDAARRAGVQAVHPGYGFLSENAAFAQAVLDAGMVFVGPGPAAMRAMGDKARARQRAAALGLPVLPGYDAEDQSDATLWAQARRIGYPVMLKAAAGGGGRGMRLVRSHEALPGALASARSEAASAFGDARLVLERALRRPRHVEVQVLADAHGHTLHVGDRDCSLQRRHQKLVEEAPAPGLAAGLRRQMGEAAVAVASAAGYVGAGTVEFLVDGDAFFFIEMNTRLQVEHPVTEAVLGLDLVEWQFRIARGEVLPWPQETLAVTGHAIEVRLCAEDPAQDFLPQCGRVVCWRPPPQVRVDHAVREGMTLSPFYDSMVAKLVAHGTTREQARRLLRNALEDTVLFGVVTNRAFLAQVVDHPAFAAGDLSTAFLDEHFGEPAAREIVPDDETWALAAWLAVQATADLPDTWRGFSSTGLTDLPVRLAWRGRERTGRVRITAHEGATVAIDQTVRPPDTRRRFASHRVGDRLHLQTAAGEWLFEDRRLAARVPAADPRRDGRLVASMSGRVVLVHVVPGAKVRRDEPLVVLDAMKMEHVLAARVSGTVSAVHVAVHDQVSPGTLLVVVEPDPPGTGDSGSPA